MGSDGGATAAALTAVRVASYAMLGYSLFHLAMFIGKWYESTILIYDELKMVLDSADADGDGTEDLYIKHSDTSKFVFIGLPILLSAALGGVYEALWKRREASLSNKQQLDNGSGPNSNNGGMPEEKEDNRPGIFAFLHNVVHYQYRPLGRYSPWLTVGESTVLFLWVIAMGSQCWQGNLNHGNHFHDIYAPCEDDPSSWCSQFTGEPGPTPNQYRLRMVAVFMGLVCSAHFAIILIPVSRDSKIWSALGVPFERAVLYHAIAGHLAFWSLFMHAFLFVVHWVNCKGWDHAVHESIHFDPDTHGGVDTPMGWMALLCAIPMWVTSVNWVRRKYYSLFKLAHWLFIGVFVFSVMHWAPNALYFLGGLTLYIVHVLSRLESWKRWRYWNRWFKPTSAPNANNSLVSVATNDSYTRLVLRNPKGNDKAGDAGGEPARGGSFVYIAVPGALGTDEAHAITVALRGPPPSFSSSPSSSLPVSAEKQALLGKSNNVTSNSGGAGGNDVFTVYIKDLGRWTEALRDTARGAELVGADAPRSLLVDVDGFYGRMQSFHSMKTAEGVNRVVVIAGGSGMTSLMGFIQDWCVAALEGADVPEVHLAWCCRYLSEMELVGEALPSMLASAGSKKDTHFSMSLYCSGSKAGSSTSPESLSVTWPLDPLAYANTTTQKDVIGENYIASSLNHSARVLIAGLAAFGGYVLGFYEVDRRGLMNVFHEGAIIFVLMVICIVSSLVVCDWLALLVRKCFLGNNANDRSNSRSRSPQVAGRSPSRGEESKVEADVELSTAVTAVTYEVKPGRVPTEALLRRESEMAKSKKVDEFDGGGQRHYSIKVLTSGPNSLVNKVLAESHAIDWQLFDAEAFSFEF